MAEETLPLIRRATVSARVANVLFDEEFENPDGTPADWTGFLFEGEVNTAPDGSGTKLADLAITVEAGRITARLGIIASDTVVSGAQNRQAYADILCAASAEAEPEKLVTLTLPTSGTVTTWGEEAPA